MKKTKVALAMGLISSGLLAGCGGGDSDAPSSGTVSAGGVVVVTGVDGYYQNALVFADVDNDGELDVGSDTILGLTNSSGQLAYNYSGDLDSVIQGSIALQTLVPGGDKQQELINYDADTYSGVYTIDTDFPDTALDTEMVLRAPVSSVSETSEHSEDDESYTAVVSPISDLVSIQIDSGKSEEEAESEVATALGVDEDALYSDYADEDSGDAETQKKAQIVAESKAYAISENEDYDTSATSVAEQAASTVSSMTDDEINDEDNVPVVLIESSSGSVVITVETNSAATVDESQFNTIQDELSALDMTGAINWSADVSSLFTDSDQSSLTIELSDIPDADETGITVALSGNTLQITATEVLETDDVTFNLFIEDKTSQDTVIGKAIASFTLSNSAPTADSTVASELQADIDNWSIQAGEEFSNSFSVADLFEDEDSDTLSYTFSPNTVNGLAITEEDGTVTLSGTPTEDTVTGDTEDTVFEFTVIASDGKKYADVTFTLPEILEADSDGDSYVDSQDAFPDDPTEWVDSDSDGYGDNEDDAFPSDATEWADGDGDGYGDNEDDLFPNNAAEWADGDGDGHGDNEDDLFPNDATEWADSDGDGYGDNEDDAFPNDATEWADSDEDGYGDNEDDAFPNDATEWADGDGDGYGDNEDDLFPDDATEWADSDGDGTGDNEDTTNSLELNTSDFENQRYYVLWTETDSSIQIQTRLFGTDEMESGYGYLDDGEDSYFADSGEWEIVDGDLVITDWGVRFSLHERGDGYIKTCFSGDTTVSATCADDEVSTWYESKSDAKAYVAANASGFTEVDLSTITDSTLNEYFVDTEYTYAENVHRVNIEDMGVASLAGMSQFTNLQRLYAQNNSISDISPLSGLSDMDRLEIAWQYDSSTGDDISLQSYSAIYTMTSLTRLSISGYSDDDSDDTSESFDLATFLADHTDKSSITRLRLYSVGLDDQDVEAIADMPNLTKLALDDNSDISDLTPLESNSWNYLTDLNLNWNGGDDYTYGTDSIEGLPALNIANMISAGLDLSQLQSLELSQTDISTDELTTIASGVGENLDTLQLRKMPTADYSNLFTNLNTPNLRVLKLGYSPSGGTSEFNMTNIDDNLTPSSLQKLYLQEGEISGFDIADFTSLTKLRLNMSNITDTTESEFETAVNSISTLTSLDLSDFSIQDIDVYCSDLELNDTIDCSDDSSESEEDQISYTISSGVVTFTDETSIPEDAMIRIVPNTFSDADDYGTNVVCYIDDDGNFGDNCLINSDDEDELNTAFADSSETYEIVVFANTIDPDECHAECLEYVYKYVGYSESSWASISISSEDGFQRTAADCGDSFSEEGLEGQTLYMVWWGTDEDSDTTDSAHAYEMAFGSDNVLTAQKFIGGSTLHNGYYRVSDGKLITGDDLDSLTNFDGDYNIVISSSDDYLKTYYYDDSGNCDNVDLYFYDEATATSYANSLTGPIGECPSDSDSDDSGSDDSGSSYTAAFGSYTNVWNSDDFIELVQDYADANGYQFPGIHNLVSNYNYQFEFSYSSSEDSYYFVFLSDGSAAYGSDRSSLTEAKWSTETDADYGDYGYQLVTIYDADNDDTLFQFVLFDDQYNEDTLDFTDLSYDVSVALYNATDNTAEELTLEVANADTDNDGIYNDVDTDDDGDGVSDTSDTFPLDASESADSDGDGIGDNSDNCVDTSNSAQSDYDGDGIGDMCETATEADLTTAKDFVTDVRTAYNSVDTGGDLSTGIEAFSDDLEVINDLATDDLDTLTTNINYALAAIAEAVDDGVTTSPYTAENGVEVTISGDVYSVTAPASVTATVTEYSIDSTETNIDYDADCTESAPCTGTYDESGSVNFDVVISASQNNLTLTGSGTAVVVNLVVDEDQTYVYEDTSGSYEEEAETFSFTVESIDLSLTSAQLSYADTDSDATFEGSLQVTIAGISDYESWFWDYSSDDDGDSGSSNAGETDSTTADSATLTLDGTLTSTSSDGELGVYLNISLDNSLGFAITMSDTWGNTWDHVSGEWSSTSESESSEETEDAYVKFDITARVSTDLTDAANNAMAASVELVVDREEYDNMDVQVTVDYNNVDTILSATYGLYSDDISDITISDGAGTEAVLTELDDILGTIYVNGVAVATIEEANGLTVIRYSDGYFESIF